MQRAIGIGLDGSNVTITIGRTQIPCLTAEYGDNLSVERLRNMGEQYIAETTDGQYEVEDGKLKMSSVVFRSLFAPLAQQDGMGLERVTVVISKYHPDLGGDSDLLQRVRFIGLKEAIENSNKAQETEIKMVYDQIFWTNRRITINKINRAVPLTASKF